MKTLIVFAKVPVPGQVKTRLAASTPLDDQQACDLAEAFLKDTFTAATLTAAENIIVAYAGADDDKPMQRIMRRLSLGVRNERRFTFVPQEGDDFTSRVGAAFAHAARLGGEALVMIGADAPFIAPSAVDAAFDFVDDRSGMVLGPSGEGGVYLIGYPAGTPVDFGPVFDDGAEIEQLLLQAKRMNMPLRLLPPELDVDVAADLVTLVGRIRTAAYGRKFTEGLFPFHTHEAVEALGLSVTRGAGESRSKGIAVAPARQGD